MRDRSRGGRPLRRWRSRRRLDPARHWTGCRFGKSWRHWTPQPAAEQVTWSPGCTASAPERPATCEAT